jgi:hypothetical protein
MNPQEQHPYIFPTHLAGLESNFFNGKVLENMLTLIRYFHQYDITPNTRHEHQGLVSDNWHLYL